jgi:hypothetical protein
MGGPPAGPEGSRDPSGPLGPLRLEPAEDHPLMRLLIACVGRHIKSLTVLGAPDVRAAAEVLVREALRELGRLEHCDPYLS